MLILFDLFVFGFFFAVLNFGVGLEKIPRNKAKDDDTKRRKEWECEFDNNDDCHNCNDDNCCAVLLEVIFN